MSDLRIATRGSKLAMAQASWVAVRLRELNPGIEIELVEITTAGDDDRTSPMVALTEMGAFVRAVQQAVLDGRADLAVHSGKDLPVQGPPDLVPYYPEREEPWDVMCGSDLDSLPPGARVGTGSPRRAAQLRQLRPDLRIDDIRGNIDTRIAKVAEGEFDAVILAAAGLNRIGLASKISQKFSLKEMVPAAAQAALSIEVLADGPAESTVSAIDHANTRRAVEAERTVLALTNAGCRSALGVYAEVTEDKSVHLSGFVEDAYGPRTGQAAADSPDEAAGRLKGALKL